MDHRLVKNLFEIAFWSGFLPPGVKFDYLLVPASSTGHLKTQKPAGCCSLLQSFFAIQGRLSPFLVRLMTPIARFDSLAGQIGPAVPLYSVGMVSRVEHLSFRVFVAV